MYDTCINLLIRYLPTILFNTIFGQSEQKIAPPQLIDHLTSFQRNSHALKGNSLPTSHEFFHCIFVHLFSLLFKSPVTDTFSSNRVVAEECCNIGLLLYYFLDRSFCGQSRTIRETFKESSID